MMIKYFFYRISPKKYFTILNIFLGVIIFSLIFSSCCTETVCVDFTPEELAWAPYNKGDTIKFKSSLTDSVITFVVESVNKQKSYTKNCVTSKGTCEFWFTTVIVPVVNTELALKKICSYIEVYGDKKLWNPPNDPKEVFLRFEYHVGKQAYGTGGLINLDIVNNNSMENYKINDNIFEKVKLYTTNSDFVKFDSTWVSYNFGIAGFHVKGKNEYFNIILK